MASRSALYVMTTWSRGRLALLALQVFRPAPAGAEAGALRAWRGLGTGSSLVGADRSRSPAWSPAWSPGLATATASAGDKARHCLRRAVRGWHAEQRRFRPSESCDPSCEPCSSTSTSCRASGVGLAVRGRRDGEGEEGGNADAGSR